MRGLRWALFLGGALILSSCARQQARDIQLEWVSDDETYVFSKVKPKIVLSAEAPAALAGEAPCAGEPRYGALTLGNVAGGEMMVAVDLVPDEGATELLLWVDRNGDGDLSDEEAVHLARYADYPDYYHAEGVELTWLREGAGGREEVPGTLDLLLQWDRDDGTVELRPSYQGRLRGALPVGEQDDVGLLVFDADLNGCYDERDLLVVDTDRDGELDGARNSVELYHMNEAFVVGNRAWVIEEISLDGRRLSIAPARGEVGPRVKLVAGMPAPEFTLSDLGGESVPFSSYRGHPLILVFWATW